MNRIEELLLVEATLVDFKEELEERKPKSWLKCISAFANGMGGSLVYGIVDKTLEIKGVDNAQELGEKISRIIENHLIPLPSFELVSHVYKGKHLLEVKVKSGTDTPYYVEFGGVKETFIRNGSDSLPAPNHMLHELILKGSHQTFDAIVSKEQKKDYSFTLFEATYLERTGTRIKPSDYVSFGLATSDGYLTNAGKLLADQHIVYNSRVFCTRWSGIEKGSIFDDAKDDKEFEGNLIYLKKNVSDFIKSNSKVRFQKDAEYRVEKPDYAERAVTEALVNALIHRSYLLPGTEIHVDMYDDRLEIISPGGLVDGGTIQSKDIFSIESQRRNPIIADLFHRMKFMERRGSGLRDIVGETAKLLGYTEDMKPKFFSTNNNFRVIIRNVNYCFKVCHEPINEPINESTKELINKVINEFKESINEPINEPINLSDIEWMIVQLIKENSAITRTEMVIRLKYSESTIKRAVDSLVNRNIIRRVGSKKKGHWELI